MVKIEITGSDAHEALNDLHTLSAASMPADPAAYAPPTAPVSPARAPVSPPPVAPAPNAAPGYTPGPVPTAPAPGYTAGYFGAILQ